MLRSNLVNNTSAVGPKLCCISDFEEQAKYILSKPLIDYFNGGANGEETLQNNTSSFKKLRIRPRCLVDATIQNLCTQTLSQNVDIPFGISPTGMQKMAHADGEVASARAIGEHGGIYILSTASTISLEEVAQKAPNTIKWFQLYILRNRKLSEEIVKRAEKAGYKALVLTVDANVIGMRYKDERNGFFIPSHLT